MARIRSIHPGWFTDEAWVSVSFEARLLGIGIWTECDDQGVFEWKPITIKMRLFPADNLDIAALLAELADAGLVRQFDVGGKKYGAVRNFCKFQRPKKPRPVHPMPSQFRTYVGSDDVSGELDDVEDGSSGEPEEDEAPPVPRKGENPKQMEVEGERRGIGGVKGAGRAGDHARGDGAPSGSPQPPGELDLGHWLRNLAGTEPVVTDLNIRPIQALLDEGLTRDDVAAGIAAAIDDPEFRPRTWKSLVGWVRRAARDRLEAAPKARSGSRRGPDAPTALPDPAALRRHQIEMAADHFRGRWHPNWPTTHKPDHPDCVLPDEVVEEAKAIVDAERAMSPAERAERLGFAVARH